LVSNTSKTMSEFRAPVAPEPTTTPVKDQPIAQIGDSVQTHAPELVATYSEDMGKPYVAKYLDLETVWDKEPTMSQELKEIEGFIQDQVKRGNLENSTKATDKYLKEIERKAGLTGYESATKRISTLIAYIDFRKVVDA
jgi:hypothetical protein